MAVLNHRSGSCGGSKDQMCVPKYEHAHVVPLEKDQVYDPADASK